MTDAPVEALPAPDESPALELLCVSKHFGQKRAVDGLTLTLPRGAFLGLLGRNGAGKSTTLKLVTGLLAPTSGTIRVLGLDLAKEPLAVKRLIGVMPEELGLFDKLTGPQYLRFTGRMHGLSDGQIDARQAELFDKLDLRPEPGTLLCDYSYGMKKKLSLSAALLHGPRLVFLDEPFEGIDPVTSRTIKEILHSLRSRGVTLVLTSHILEVVEKTCPLIAIVDQGKLLEFGTLDELRARRGAESLEAMFLELLGVSREGSLSWM
jgi:ABC-2 type transport system ATP-binding protein